jgi:hypothetical protein
MLSQAFFADVRPTKRAQASLNVGLNAGDTDAIVGFCGSADKGPR